MDSNDVLDVALNRIKELKVELAQAQQEVKRLREMQRTIHMNLQDLPDNQPPSYYLWYINLAVMYLSAGLQLEQEGDDDVDT